MSTKIFDAYRLPRSSGMTAWELFNLSNRIRVVMDRRCRSLFSSFASKEFAEVCDNAALGTMSELERTPLQIVGSYFDTGIQRLKRGERTPWDFSAQWSFYHTSDAVLLRFFGEQPVVAAFEKEFPEFQDYHFQTSTDRPKSVSARSWRKRRTDWDLVMMDKTAAQSGLTSSIWTDFDGPDLRDCLSTLTTRAPSIERRALSLATTTQMNEWFRKKLNPSDKHAPHVYSEAYGEWMLDVLALPETQKGIAELAYRYTRALPARITKELVQMPAKEINSNATRRFQAIDAATNSATCRTPCLSEEPSNPSPTLS